MPARGAGSFGVLAAALGTAGVALAAISRRRCQQQLCRAFTRRRATPTAEEGGEEEDGDSGDGFLNGTSAAVLLFILAVLYGGNVPLLKAIETDAPLDITGPQVLTLRFIAVCTLVIPWMLANSQKVGAVIVPATELSLWLWSGYTFQILGLEKTSATIAAITTALVGVTVQALEVAVDGQPLRPAVAASSVGVFAGLWIFATAPGGAENPVGTLVNRVLGLFSSLMQQSKPLPHEAVLGGVPGEVLAVLGAALFGVHVWRCNRIVAGSEGQEGPAKGDFELSLAAVQIFVVTLLCFVFSTLDNPYSLDRQLNAVARLSPGVQLQVAACGILCTGLPSVLELYAFKVVPPAVASLIYSTIPLWGTVLGVIFLKDALGPQSIAGGAVILASALGPSLSDIFASPGPGASEAGDKSPCFHGRLQSGALVDGA